MGLSQRLELRQGQSLVMTPQLLQAIKLLQLSHLELAAHVEAELERNPMLERPDGEIADDEQSVSERPEAGTEDEPAADLRLGDDFETSRAEIENSFDAPLDNVFPDDSVTLTNMAADVGDALPLTLSPWTGAGGGGSDGEVSDFEATLTAETSLYDHLVRQLDLATPDPVERLVGRYLVDAVNEAGYLAEPVEAIAERLGADPAFVERVLARVQTFDPTGVGARSLAECLAIQLKERNRFDPAMRALVGHLSLVAKRDFAALRRLCGVDDEDLVEMLAELRQL